MKKTISDIKLSLLLIILICLSGSLCLPIIPIDETRYVSVAWEMWNHHSFLVPLLNGTPYSHKPPLFFWLIHISWKLFGVNAMTPRLIPGVFSLINLILVYRISQRLWPTKNRLAEISTLVLASTLMWGAWSVAIMFDMVLTFWVLVGLTGILRATEQSRAGWLLFTLGIAGGFLTKGPAVLVYLLPIPLARVLWDTRRKTSVRATWYLGIAGAAVAGFAIALLWAVPAAIQGGETYGNEILWKQTTNRITSSFAHCRPFWWYLPVIPLLFFPWILFRPSFSKLNLKTADMGTRFCLIWIGLPLLIFSFISGKQVHYLMPFIPAGALLIGKNISQYQVHVQKPAAKLIGCIYIILGLITACLPFLPLRSDILTFSPVTTITVTSGFLLTGSFLVFFPLQSPAAAIKAIAISTMTVCVILFAYLKNTVTEAYDIKPVAQFIQKRMDEGAVIVNLSKYHGQYHFLGRLEKPIIVISKDDQAVQAFEKEHPDALFISYPGRKNPLPEGIDVCFSQKYRGRTVVIWKQPADRP